MDEDFKAIGHSKYFFLLCFIVLVGISIYIIRNYLIAVFGAMVLSYIFFPVYSKVYQTTKNKALSSFLVALILILVISVPVFFISNSLINESVKFFHTVNNVDVSDFSERISDFFKGNVDLAFYVKEMINKFALYIAESTSSFILSIPSKAITAFIMLFVMYYLFKDGKEFVEKLKNYLPLKERYKDGITQKFDEVVYAVLYGVVITAFIQGVVGGIGLWVFGVGSPILLGSIMILLAMIPFVGPWLIWLPASVIKIIEGDNVNGFGLLIYGILVVSTVDNIIRPKLIGMKSKVHPVIVLVGVLGGLSVFGLLGVIIGPLILAISVTFVQIYLSEKDGLP
ncbi:MAG: AI-2E family transporter [Nanoarchaeota archaeon]